MTRGEFFSMVYLKAYSLTKYVANYHHCDSDNAQQYYKNLNPQGLSDNYVQFCYFVRICHELSHFNLVNILKIHCQPSTTKPGTK